MGYHDFEYGFNAGAGEMAGEVFGGIFGVFMGIFLVFYLLILAFGIVSYVLQSLGFYTIAKRRGIKNPWLSWVPVGNMWILGSISDQYQYVAKGRVRNRRKVLMGLTIAMFAAMIPMYISVLASAFAEAAGMDADEVLLGTTVAILLITYVAILAISVTAMVFQYIALYDLYMSCEPGNGVLYLVLSIFFGITLPFFVFTCRKKDGGMPPRKTEEQPQPVIQAACEPVETAEEEPPADAQPEEE